MREVVTSVFGWIEPNQNWIIPMTVSTIISIISCYVAISNHRCAMAQRLIQKENFRFQLFERRFKVFEEAKRALSDILAESTDDNEAYVRFGRTKEQSSFLFGSEIDEYFDITQNHLIELFKYREKVNQGMKSLGSTPDHEYNCDKEYEIQELVENDFKQLNELMKPYLDFSSETAKATDIK